MDLARTYEEHVSRVYGFFAYRLPGPADAEDLTAATFERAVRHADRYDARRASVATWLLAIAQNVLVDHYRRSGRRPEELRDGGDFDALPEPGDEDRRRVHGLEPELERALEALSDRERLVIALRFGGDLKGSEIAAITELSEANVHQILSRSLRQLRRSLPEPAPRVNRR